MCGLVFVAFNESGCNNFKLEVLLGLSLLMTSSSQHRSFRKPDRPALPPCCNAGKPGRAVEGKKDIFCWEEKQWKQKGTENGEVKMQSEWRLGTGEAILQTTSSESICRVEKCVGAAEQRGEEWGRKRKRAKGRGRDPHETIDEILPSTQPRKTVQEQGCGKFLVLNETETFWLLLIFWRKNKNNPPWITSRLCCAFSWTRRPPSATASWPF